MEGRHAVPGDGIVINCPRHQQPLTLGRDAACYACRDGCRFPSPGPGIVDLLAGDADATSEHYTLQWGPEVDFASFYRQERAALTAMTSRQMGWPTLIARIREQAQSGELRLFDAACGYGGLFGDLFEDPAPVGLRYVGADIHSALPSIVRPAAATLDRAQFVRWDISDPLPTDERYDVIVCRAAIHHTADPIRTFGSLVDRLADKGTLALTVYAKKAPMREAADDALRERIVPLPAREALALAHQFTTLGRDLQASGGTVEITTDAPLLQIRAGRYPVHEFIYDHFLKCWFNDRFGERYSDIVNFDWYHPPFAFRYALEEVEAWFDAHGLVIVDTQTTRAQHYVEGRRP